MREMKSTRLHLNAAKKRAEIDIYGFIGDWWDGLDARTLKRQLDDAKVDEIQLNVHSNGGIIMEGFAFFNLLLAHPARVVARIDGIAASMASVIAMAADEIQMPSNGQFMIHNPAVAMWGEADDLRREAGVLDAIKGSIVDAYRRHSNLSSEEISEAMDEETWYSAEQALEAGFVTEITGSLEAVAAIDLDRFNHTPAAAAALTRKEILMDPQKSGATNPPQTPEEKSFLANLMAALRGAEPGPVEPPEAPPKTEPAEEPRQAASALERATALLSKESDRLASLHVKAEVNQDLEGLGKRITPAMKDAGIVNVLAELKAAETKVGDRLAYNIVLDSLKALPDHEGMFAGALAGDDADAGAAKAMTAIEAKHGIDAARAAELDAKYPGSIPSN